MIHRKRNGAVAVLSMDSQSHSQLHSAWAVLAHRPPSPFEAAFVRNLSRALRPINVPLTVMLDATTRRSNASDCGTLRRCTHDPLLAAKTEAAWLSRTADANVAVVNLQKDLRSHGGCDGRPFSSRTQRASSTGTFTCNFSELSPS